MRIHTRFVLTAAFVLLARRGSAQPSYAEWSQDAMRALGNWYDSGAFDSTGYWNSANDLTAMVDYAARTGDTTYDGKISDAIHSFDPDDAQATCSERGVTDDEGWWALAFIDAYDYLHDSTALNLAVTLFNDMKQYWDPTTCGGGLEWNTCGTIQKNAIENELFMALAIRLHARVVPDTADSTGRTYLDWANTTLAWFLKSGMINASSLVNDGLTPACANNHKQTWTYNQGVILGALVDMQANSAASCPAGGCVALAKQLAKAVINSTLLAPAGILTEPPSDDGSPCATTGDDARDDCPTFKGVFMRNLSYLTQSLPAGDGDATSFQAFIVNNAQSIWYADRSSCNDDPHIPYLGMYWGGAYEGYSTRNASRQGSAIDALNAAIPYGGMELTRYNTSITSDVSATCKPVEAIGNAADGDYTTKWCYPSDLPGPHWLEVDFAHPSVKNPLRITDFSVRHAGSGPTDLDKDGWNTRRFRIDYSLDGTTFVAAMPDQYNVCNVSYFHLANPLLGVRAVRLWVTQTASDPTQPGRIYEFSAYGTLPSNPKTSCGMASGDAAPLLALLFLGVAPKRRRPSRPV